MANVLILNPNTDTFGRQSIPTALTSALLKKHGHAVSLFDTTFYDLSYLLDKPATHEDLNAKLKFFKKVNYSKLNIKKEKIDVIKLFEERIRAFKPDFIIFSFWGSHLHGEGEFHAFFHGRRIIEIADTGEIPIIVGGTVPTWDSVTVLEHPKISYVVRGEGELVFLELADRVDSGRDWCSVENLCFKLHSGEVQQNPLRPLINQLDQLPYADFDLYEDRTFYRPYHGKMYRCIDYELSRGCIYQCAFCLSPFQQGVYGRPKNFRREKSIPKIIDEISYLKNKHQLNLIRYQDETFLTMHPDKLKKLAYEYRDKVNLPFIIEATIPSISEDKLRYLKEMGCLSIGLGLESGSQYLRDNIINKPKFSNAEAIAKIKMIKKYGISMNVFCIIGFPEETREMIFETIEICYQARPPYCMVSYFQPWEGTNLRGYAISQGLLDKNICGLENSQDNLLLASLKNLKLPKEELKHLHDSFVYYVYINKAVWPLIKYMDNASFAGRCIRNLLTFYLNSRFKFIK